jgi:hypothetical protein
MFFVVTDAVFAGFFLVVKHSQSTMYETKSAAAVPLCTTPGFV